MSFGDSHLGVLFQRKLKALILGPIWFELQQSPINLRGGVADVIKSPCMSLFCLVLPLFKG